MRLRPLRDAGDQRRLGLLRAIAGPLRAVGTRLRWLVARVPRVVVAIGPTVWAAAVSAARSVTAPLTVDVDPPGPRPPGRRDWLLLLDIVVAVVLYIVTTRALIDGNNLLGRAYEPALMHLLGASGTLPLALRRRRPLLAWQIAIVAVVATTGWFTPVMAEASPSLSGPPVFLPGQAIASGLCLYTAGSRGTRTIALGLWLWSLVALVIIAAAGPNVAMGGGPTADSQDARLWTWSVAIVTLTPLFGYNVRTRRRALADLELQQRRNEQEQAARATLEERSRIARELHDVVAHNMSVIAIQAEAAPLRAPGDSSALEAELASIRTTALETLAEMRRVLGVLRAANEQAETDPAPGIDQLDALVEKVTAAGMDVGMTSVGAARPVPPGVGVSVYRIVQESLSNAMRHAPGAAVVVTLAYSDAPHVVRVRIENGPPPHGPATDGRTGPRHGLVGMRERAAMLRGELTAEPTDDGGYVVEATLPLDEP